MRCLKCGCPLMSLIEEDKFYCPSCYHDYILVILCEYERLKELHEGTLLNK